MRALAIFVIFYTAVNSEIINTNVARTVSISSQLVEIETNITFFNNNTKSISKYVFLSEPQIAEYHINFYAENGEVLNYVKSEGGVYEVLLNKLLQPKRSTLIVHKEIQLYQIKLLFKEKKLADPDVFMFMGNVHYYSRYKTDREVVRFVLKYCKIISVSLEAEYTKTRYLKFETFFNVSSNNYEELEIVYECSDPILNVDNLERIIDISHFGMIEIKENIVLRHEGTKVVGPFEREPSSAPHGAVAQITSFLPSSAVNVKYYDDIGYIFSYSVAYHKDYVSLIQKPRFPLIGGWKISYTIKYMVPTYEYLFVNDTLHALKMRTMDHVVNDAITKHMICKILLPDGATFKKITIPKSFVRRSDEWQVTSLSTYGRATVVIEGNNLTEENVEDFVLMYEYNRLNLLKAPTMIAVYMTAVLVTVIVLHTYVI